MPGHVARLVVVDLGARGCLLGPPVRGAVLVRACPRSLRLVGRALVVQVPDDRVARPVDRDLDGGAGGGVSCAVRCLGISGSSIGLRLRRSAIRRRDIAVAILGLIAACNGTSRQVDGGFSLLLGGRGSQITTPPANPDPRAGIMPRARTAAIVAARSFAAAFFMLEATLMGASLLMRRSLSL